MNHFKFSCDTNIFISGSFYYRFKSGDIVSEGEFHSDARIILDYFKKIFEKKKIKFGIITYSIKKEINDKKINILLKKMEQLYCESEPKKKMVLSEFSALLNTIDNNLKEFYTIFDIGKANINNKRVYRIKKEVEKMYNDFKGESEDLEMRLAYLEREKGRLSIPRSIKRRDVIRERTKRVLAEHKQITRLRYKEIDDIDKNILSEIIYEKKRFLQDNRSISNFTFYFISNDNHFSPKYNSNYNCFSRQITDKIKELFSIDCYRASDFKDLRFFTDEI